MAKKEKPQQGIAEQLQPLVDDDAFLTSLSQGQDPSDGADELAQLFLELRGEVEAQMPPAPVIEGADMDPEVISLGAARRRRRSRPLVSGLIGAAAATLVIAGGGAAVHNAGPGSPFYGMNQSLFGAEDSGDASVVELASTLEEMEKASANGDMDVTRALLEQARRIVNDVQNQGPKGTDAAPAPVTKTERANVTVTETATVENEAPSDAPAPVTVTEIQTLISTYVVTSAANPSNSLPQQTTYSEPTDTPNAPSAEGTGEGNGQLPPAQYQQ